jgi:hypothetical protein
LIIILCEKILVLILLFLSTSVLSANERDSQLDKLFYELKKNIPSLSPGIAQTNLDFVEHSSYRSKINIYSR